MKVGLSGGYFNYPLQKQLAYFQSMPEYLLYNGLQKVGVKVEVYGTKAYPTFKNLDVFNCHHISRTMYYLGLTKRYPLIITLHNPFIASGYKPTLNWCTLHALQHANALVALSQNEREHLINDYDLDGKRIAVIPNGLKLKLYEKPAKLQFRRKHNIPDDYKVVLTVGQLLPYKNISLLIDVFKKIHERHKKTLLIIKTLTPNYINPTKQVLTITDKMTQRELVDLYYSCDLYVQPSMAEALCTCVTEAMLCRCPVIASDVGGTNTQVINEETGLLIPPNNSKILYDAISSLLTDINKAMELGENAKKHAVKFNQDAMITAYIKLYQKVAG